MPASSPTPAAPPTSTPDLNLTNQFLIAMPAMVDPNFQGALVYISQSCAAYEFEGVVVE